MPNYDFKTLSSFDFECLVRDLLQKEKDIFLESFTAGRDGGIDLRYSCDNLKSLIIQAKHYANSTYSVLLSNLKNNEVQKVEKIKPSQYILATSVGLTPKNKDEILKTFSPFCQRTEHIYGRDDLNNLLGRFSEIEKQNFKLWLSSKSVLESILHSNIFAHTEHAVENIQKKINKYVQNKSFFDAIDILEKQNFCIIAGIPGIGKTMLAEILLVAYMDKGYEAIKISNDISEADKVLEKGKKQLFYYDDFLGQTSLGVKLNKNEDDRLLQFIEAVKRSKDKRLILTTREYILSQAKVTHEKLARADIDYRKCVIDLKSYTKANRAKILFNHVCFSDLSAQCITSLLENKNYLKIVNHRNYNPRTIEWMTDNFRKNLVEGKTYVDVFMEHLENPETVWLHAFENQISEASQCLLFALYTLPDEVFLEDMEIAFSSFYQNRADKLQRPIYKRDFLVALKELEGNFISINGEKDVCLIKFHNPSIRDFIGNYIMKYKEIVELLVNSLCFFEQLITMSGYSPYNNVIDMKIKYFEKNPELLWKKMDELFLSHTCLTTSHLLSGSRLVKKRQNIPLESRLQFAECLSRQLKSKATQAILVSMLNSIITQFNGKHKPNKFVLLDVLSNLRDSIFSEILHNDNNLDKMFISFKKSLNDLVDYVYIIHFLFYFSEWMPEGEGERISAELKQFLSKDMECIETSNDVSEIEAYALQLEEISTFGGLNLDAEIECLKERMQEVDDGGEESDYYDMSEGSRDDDEISESEIDSMFDSLRCE